MYVSIHLMLLFIVEWRVQMGWNDTFQYISCYSLSTSCLAIICACPCFNTSHVTLYHLLSHRIYYTQNSFQYISCYSLSVTRVKILGEADEFQYISCYSLSTHSADYNSNIECFNTSHVTLYQCIKIMIHSFNSCFNTSHVTLYLASFSDITFPNVGFNTSHVTLYLFQYFTCKCLSGFNTSHVTLYHLFPEYLLSV